MRHAISCCFVLVLLLFCISCGGGGGSDASDNDGPPPSAIRFTASPASGAAPLSVTFDATDAQETGWREPFSYAWNFGDGTSAVDVSTGHIYTQSGTYDATLTITDAAGSSGTATLSIQVTPPARDLSLSGTVQIPGATLTDADVNDPNVADTTNNTIRNAQTISCPVVLGGYVNQPLNGSQGSSFLSGDIFDFFAVDFTGDEVIQLIIADPHADLDLFIFDADENLVDGAVGETDAEVLDAPAAGTFYIAVHPYSGASAYNLIISRFIGDAGLAKKTGPTLNTAFDPDTIITEYTDESSQAETDAATASTFTAIPTGWQLKGASTPGCPTLLYRTDGAKQRQTARAYLSDTENTDLITAFPCALAPLQARKLSLLYAVKSLNNSPRVRYASPNFIRKPCAVAPDDPLYTYQWHYDMIQLSSLWSLTDGSGVRCAVIDTGVLTDHPDLAGQLTAGYDFISDPENALDGDGIDADPSDPGDQSINGNSSFHGTHVAGTIAGVTGNSTGIAGVAPSATLIPLRVLGKEGGYTYDIIQAVRYAAGLSNDSGRILDPPADIINMSLGGAGYTESEAALYEQIRSLGIHVVAAAGNEATRIQAYPAAYPGVTAVSAVTLQKASAFYSNYGSWIDVAAPGGVTATDVNGDGYGDGILSTAGDDSTGSIQHVYTFEQGTSMAAPHVTGFFALMKAGYPNLTPALADELLQDGRLTEDIGEPGKDALFGYGLINGKRAAETLMVLRGTGDLETPARLSVSPSSLNFGLTEDRLFLTLANAGASPLSISSVSPQDSWLQVTSNATDPDTGLGVYTVIADRSGLSEGAHSTSIRITSSAETMTIPVALQYFRASKASNASYHYILLVDDETNAVVSQQNQAPEDGAYTFNFTGLTGGLYRIYAGSDLDNDGYIGDAGEAFGAYLLYDQPISIPLNASRSGIVFSTGFRPLIASQSEACPASSSGAKTVYSGEEFKKVVSRNLSH
ncbi:MAG: hypothetical protein CSA22_08625 [Deltaproteobacteria bacterium]|nr:MAG: hypothetical protein CSA22_08625 [Deltaproteobacteria bacterium]